MKSNASIREIGNLLKNADSILIFPHLNPDGDALGSATALCLALRKLGKTAWVLMEDEVPQYISFIEFGCCTQDKNLIEKPDICICVDCGEESRFPKRADKFSEGKLKLCVDHHVTDKGFGDRYYIDESSAAAAQLIYKLIAEMGVEMDKQMANALYVGLSTDTGSFQYSNTTAETHMTAAALHEVGINHVDITVKLYQNISRKKIEIQKKVLETMEVFADGRAAIAYITMEMIEDIGASEDDAEGMVDILRNIEGVEIAIFLKEKQDGIKASMRAKTYGNVDKIAKEFGGGGHIKAAGCTIKMSMADAVEALKGEVLNGLGN